MSSGLLGLFDNVAALAKLAAAPLDDIGAAAGRASVKAAGVVVDDTAVTQRTSMVSPLIVSCRSSSASQRAR